jgi:F-type H+-transporting ATPase subunit epsilon
VTMRLRILVPTDTVVDDVARKVTAEGPAGWFCLLPRHVDLVTSLVPSVLVYTDGDGHEAFVAIDHGVLVKVGSTVRVAAARAVAGADLGRLRAAVEDVFETLDEREAQARNAVRTLEATFLRGLTRLEEVSGG